MFDLEALVQTLDEHGVEYVVIGGVAVAAHGFVRATEDLDLVPEPNPANYERIVLMLSALEATLPTAGDRRFDAVRDTTALRKGQNMTLRSAIGGIDLVQRARGIPPYSELAAAAVEAEIFGIAVKVCSLAHLRMMKLAGDRSQDRADLENLPDS